MKRFCVDHQHVLLQGQPGAAGRAGGGAVQQDPALQACRVGAAGLSGAPAAGAARNHLGSFVPQRAQQLCSRSLCLRLLLAGALSRRRLRAALQGLQGGTAG